MLSVTVKSALYTTCPRPLRAYWDRVEASNLGYRLARGAFWSLAGAVISRGLMLVASIFVARMLGKEGFGELGIIRSTVGMFGVFAGFGLGLTATKHVAEFRKSDPERAGHIIALSSLVATCTGGFMALALFVFAPWLAAHTLNAPHLSGLLRVGCLILLFSAINGAQTGALAGFEAFKTIARVNIFVGLASFPILIGGAYFGGLEGVVWGLTMSLGIHWILNHVALHREAALAGVPSGVTGCTRECNILWQFSLPATLSSVMVGPVLWGARAFLANQPHGYANLGIFAAANSLAMIITFLPGFVSSASLPILCELTGSVRIAQYRRTLIRLVGLYAAFCLPIAALLCLFSPWLISVYGHGFRQGWSSLCILSIAFTCSTVTSVVGHGIIASGKLWWAFFLNGLWACEILVTAWFLTPFGSVGLCLAFLVGYTLHMFQVGIFSAFIFSK